MLALVLILALVAPALADWQRATPGGPGGTGPTAGQVAQALNDASLLFEANRGQTDSQVRYVARGDGYAVYLTDRAAVVDYRNPAAARGIPTTGPAGVALRFDLVGGQAGQPVAQQPQPGRISYFYGNDPSRWQRDVPTYGRVVYQGVYPGIDLAYYGHGGALEYDLVVAPGADPNAIRLSIAGADSLSLSGQDLLIKTALGTLRSAAPTVYQDGPNGREVVAGQYTLAADHTVSFSLGRYDSSRPVVIDPIIWSSFIGGDSDIATRPNDGGDWGIDLVTDSAGTLVEMYLSRSQVILPDANIGYFMSKLYLFGRFS